MCRFEYLKKCLESFFEKAEKPEEIEAVILMDLDDTEYCKTVQDYCLKKKYNIQLVIKRRDIVAFNESYQNHGAQCSFGNYVWALNDECEMLTDSWDVIIKENAKKLMRNVPSGLMYIAIDDDTHMKLEAGIDKWGCCFPILSLPAIEAINGLIPAEIGNWGGDTWLFEIFKEHASFTILDLTKKITIIHHSPHSGRREPDEASETGRIGSEVLCTKGRLNKAEVNKYGIRIKTILEEDYSPFSFWIKEPVSPPPPGKAKLLLNKLTKPFRCIWRAATRSPRSHFRL